MNLGQQRVKASDMDMDYRDASGSIHHLQVFNDSSITENIFSIMKNKVFYCDLVKEEGIWMEPFHGVTAKSKEYGPLIDKFFVFSDINYHVNDPVSLSIAL